VCSVGSTVFLQQYRGCLLTGLSSSIWFCVTVHYWLFLIIGYGDCIKTGLETDFRIFYVTHSIRKSFFKISRVICLQIIHNIVSPVLRIVIRARYEGTLGMFYKKFGARRNL
jgi:hypothetical protein